MTTSFPETMDFAGFNAPCRVECEIYDLIVEGNLPPEIRGSWYRCIPDPQYPPMLGHDTYLSGDGMVSLFRFEEGHVDFRMRYVRTDRWKAERAARRSLFGLYRNPFTDDASVRNVNRTVSNTTPVWHGGRLLATKEDGLPYEVHPHTLDTIGTWNYDGKLRSQTMTAHTRLDPDTGELHFFGYEAGGLATRDVAYCIADKDGNLIHEEWFEAPFVSMMHDFVVTKDYVVFPMFPTTADLDRIKAGGPHWVYEPGRDTLVGVMPRGGTTRDIRYFRRPACSAYHFMNAYSEGGRVHMDFNVGKVNPFPFIQQASNLHVTPEDMAGGRMMRWTLDMTKPGDHIEEHVIGPGGDMPRVADKDFMKDYEIGYYQLFDPQNGDPLIAGPVGPGFNTICRLEVKTGKYTTYVPGRRCTVQEHVHIPSRTPGHEGYLAFVVDLHDQFLSEVQVLEAAHIEKGPIARIKMPLRLRVAVHGNWVNAENLP
jgi:carotenoid cleavage dioxygenase-like enzyme